MKTVDEIIAMDAEELGNYIESLMEPALKEEYLRLRQGTTKELIEGLHSFYRTHYAGKREEEENIFK